MKNTFTLVNLRTTHIYFKAQAIKPFSPSTSEDVYTWIVCVCEQVQSYINLLSIYLYLSTVTTLHVIIIFHD